MVWEHEPAAGECFHSFFEFSQIWGCYKYLINGESGRKRIARDLDYHLHKPKTDRFLCLNGKQPGFIWAAKFVLLLFVGSKARTSPVDICNKLFSVIER